ncbi:MAG: hypothetical protein ACTTIR_00090 [Eggerthia catenaformis]|nr:hypothetical protein [Eggerthia catenaformis]
MHYLNHQEIIHSPYKSEFVYEINHYYSPVMTGNKILKTVEPVDTLIKS